MARYHAALPCPVQDFPDSLAAFGKAARRDPGVPRDVCR
jgi:hypothetical protein